MLALELTGGNHVSVKYAFPRASVNCEDYDLTYTPERKTLAFSSCLNLLKDFRVGD